MVDNTVSTLLHFAKCKPENLIAWFGPAIGPGAFEVGDDVKEAFTSQMPNAAKAFSPIVDGKWLANIYLLARQRLHRIWMDDNESQLLNLQE